MNNIFNILYTQVSMSVSFSVSPVLVLPKSKVVFTSMRSV